MKTNTKLKAMYKLAAQMAFDDGVRASNEVALRNWICKNCKFPLECYYYLILGIGSELADLWAQKAGFENEAHRALHEAYGNMYFPLI